LRALWPERALDATGPVALRDAAISITLLLAVVSVAFGIGLSILRRLSISGLTQLGIPLFACALGLGALSLANLGLALLGWLRPLALAIELIIATAVFGPSVSFWRRKLGGLLDLVARWRSAPPLPKVFVILALVIGCLAAINALSPAWDYDGLMYHLVGPKQFLAAGRIYPNPDNWYVNGPFAVEMLFTYGLAWGDDVFPKLLHLSTAVLLVLATYSAGKRWLGERGGWLSAAILMGVVTLPIWSSFAYIDMAWSMFEFLALFATLEWAHEGQSRLLILAGILIGLAMGSKYLGLMGWAVLGSLVFLVDLRTGWRNLLADGLRLCLPAVIVASPWYLKNWAWFGNPVYPLYFGGPGWDATRLGLYSAYLNSYGVGSRPIDFLLLPWNIYAHHERFGAVMNRINVPSVLFPLALAYPWVRKSRIVTLLLVTVFLRGALWAIGSQQLRFLMPIYPAVAVVAGYGVLEVSARFRKPWSLFLPMLAIGMTLLTLFYQLVILFQIRPDRAVLGEESRRAFVDRIVFDQRGVEVAVAAAGDSRALLLGDGRGYYCLPTCIPDPDHFRWAEEISSQVSDVDLSAWFTRLDARFLAISLEDIDFLLQHDPSGTMGAAIQRLEAYGNAGCLSQLYRDDNTIVYRVGCSNSP